MKADKVFNRGTIKFTFTDEDGEVFSSFRMNPTDVNLLKRAEEVAAGIDELKGRFSNDPTSEDILALNCEIEKQINYLLGYDASRDIFGEVTATTVSQDGDIFAFVVLDTITEKLKPELEKRKLKMQKSIERYTAKYR